MTLMYCPACGDKVSTYASACPHCGFPVVRSAAIEMLERRSYLATVSGWMDDARILEARLTSSEDMLRLLAVDEDWNVREAVAENECTPADVVYQLSGDANPRVSDAARGNALFIAGLRRSLAENASAKTRRGIAVYGSTSEDFLRNLEGDEGSHVREATVKNESTPREVRVSQDVYDDDIPF